MSLLLQRLAFRWLARTTTALIADCVHFAGFRYGRQEINPYENYVAALVRGDGMDRARVQFTEFLRHYRPRHLGEALGLKLEREYPLWCYPWSRRQPTSAWRGDPAEVPDIITHYSPRGILRSRIDEEFGWLERCLGSIQKHGYQPAKFSGDPAARQLVGFDGTMSYIIHDGNHRLAVLGALGVKKVAVRQVPQMTVREEDLARWPGVTSGRFTTADARTVFRAYFDGRQVARTTEKPADLLEP